MPSQVAEGNFSEPELEAHVAGWCLVFYFHKDSLSISLPCVYAPLCVLALGYHGVILKGLTDVGKAL